jgi:type 1 glutamine amidotransferase
MKKMANCAAGDESACNRFLDDCRRLAYLTPQAGRAAVVGAAGRPSHHHASRGLSMKLVLPGLLAVLLAGAPGTARAADTKDTRPGAKKRLLVITESKGFVHDVVNRHGKDLSLAEKVLTELGQKSGDFDVVCSQDSRKEITAENLKHFDAVFFYTTGELPLSEVQKSDLLAFIRSGKGFAGSHSATDTFYKWAQYGDVVGAYFAGHPPGLQKIRVIVEDTHHPATKHLGKSFAIEDEIYKFRGPYSRDKLHVLMHIDMGSTKNLWRPDGDNPLAWTHQYGKGRVFYTALGHAASVWEDPRFQQHLLGGLRYVLGLAQGDATPSAVEQKR